MMKSKDCATATALIIQGYLRPIELEHSASESKKSMALFECLSAIRQECSDWAENLPMPDGDGSALEPNAFSFDLMVGQVEAPRTPYNLISAAISLYREAVDLSGPESALHDFQRRLQAAKIETAKPAARGNAGFVNRNVTVAQDEEIRLLIEAADSLVAEIDAATDRPIAKLALWDVAVEKLRSLGVVPEERCLAPANW